MKHVVNFILLFSFLTGARSMAQVKPEPSSSTEDLISSSERYFTERIKSDKIVGISVALIHEGKVIWKKGFGYADRENKIPMTENTVINIGSITKTFTALSVMQLHEAGFVNINLPIQTYLPDFKPNVRPGILLDSVTVKSIITHTSGIQSDVWKNSDLNTGQYTDVLGFINDTHLTYPANMVGLYSNSGYNILGHLIKTVSREDYAHYVHHHILKPLKMSHSGFAMDPLTHRTKLYAGGELIKEYELRDIASGGIYASMTDMANYAIGLLNAYHGKKNKIIRQKTIQEMFSIQNGDVPLETNKKGLGWFMFKNDSTVAVYHAGSAGFAQAKFLLFPNSNAAVIVMTNTAEGGRAAEEFCFNLLPRFGLSIPDLFPAPITGVLNDPSEKVTVSAADLSRHTGHYAESSSYNTIYLNEGQLHRKDGDNVFVLKPVSKNEFVPYKIEGKDTVERKMQRLFFLDIHGYHFLVQRVKNREYNLGYQLKSVDPAAWSNWVGLYEHAGYQMLIGDSKFKSAELYLSGENVLMLRLKTLGSTNDIPLDVIDEHYALSSGVNSGFGGFNVKFKENGTYRIIEFAGITFQKRIE